MATASQPLANRPFNLDASLWRFVTRELAPEPGRLAFAARIATSAAIMLLIGEACHSEVLFVALFIPLLLPRDTPQQTWAGTKGTIIISWVACLNASVLVVLTADLPGARVLGLALGIFVCMLLSRGLHQPSIAAIGPVVISEVLTLMDRVNSAEAAITAGLWLALMMSAGCLVATAVDFLYPHAGPQKRITDGILDRLKAAAAVLKHCGGAELKDEEQGRAQKQDTLALAGTSNLRKLLPALSTQPSVEKDYVLRLSAVLNGIDLLSDQVVQLANCDASDFSQEQKAFTNRLSQGCDALAEHIQQDVTTSRQNDEAAEFPASPDSHEGPGQLIADIDFQLSELRGLWSSKVPTSKDAVDATPSDPQKPAQRTGSFVSSDDIRFALKVTFASMICYVIYNGVAWQGISTALLTCYLTADTTIGGTFRKLVLRIAGVLVGGLLFGIAGIALITSHLDNVVEFTLYVTAIFFTAGWVAKGSPRVSYAGSQIGISFGLVALMTPIIPSQIVEPRDRLVGVLLGTIVMWLVFTRIWPVDTIAAQKQAVANLLRKAGELVLLAIDGSPANVKSSKVRELRDSINHGIMQAEDQVDLSDYESKEKQDIQSALRKCLAQTQGVVMLEIAEVDLTIRSAGNVNASAGLDTDNASKAAAYLSLLATQVVEGRQQGLQQLKSEESHFQTSYDGMEDPGRSNRNGRDGNNDLLLARANIQRRRNALLKKLFQSVEVVTASAH